MAHIYRNDTVLQTPSLQTLMLMMSSGTRGKLGRRCNNVHFADKKQSTSFAFWALDTKTLFCPWTRNQAHTVHEIF